MVVLSLGPIVVTVVWADLITSGRVIAAVVTVLVR